MIKPMIVYDESAEWIDAVFCLPKQLCAGDVIYRPPCIGQSYYIPAHTFEIESITTAPHPIWRTCYEVEVRYDYGGRDVLVWPAWNIAHECVVSGSKINRANMEAGAVKKTYVGWVWIGED